MNFLQNWRWQWPTFSEPMVLLALIVPALLTLFLLVRRSWLPQRRVVLPVDGLQARAGWYWRTLLGFAGWLPVGILFLVILILAGLQVFGPPQQKRSLTNIQIAVDVSGSMTAAYGEGDRYDAAMQAVNQFVDTRRGDAFGLTFFGDAYVHWVPLTSDPSAIRCATPFMKPEIAPPAFGGTSIGKALRACKKELTQRDEGDRMIILIRDRISFDLQDYDVLAQELQAEKITLFTVICADFDPQPELVAIGNATDGGAFRAGDPEVLQSVFRRIDSMKKARLTPTFVDTVDYFQPFAAVGLILFFLATLSGFGLRVTPW